MKKAMNCMIHSSIDTIEMKKVLLATRDNLCTLVGVDCTRKRMYIKYSVHKLLNNVRDTV